MKCDQFTEAVQGIVRNESEFAALKEALTAHTFECEACAELLAAQQSLQSRLELLAASVENVCASPATESLLIQAFRNGYETGRTRRPILARFAFRGRWAVAVSLAAAAALLVIAGVPWLVKRSADRGQLADQSRGNSQSKASKPQQPGSTTEGVGSGSLHDSDVADPIVTNIHHRPHQEVIWPASTVARLRRPVGGNAGHSNDDNGETFTDFMPVGLGAGAIPMDGAQMLRVKLPRSAMLPYGLPVNPERADEPITADVIVGNDGMARAIRFVHESATRQK